MGCCQSFEETTDPRHRASIPGAVDRSGEGTSAVEAKLMQAVEQSYRQGGPLHDNNTVKAGGDSFREGKF
jgi:hypothetical protein